MALALYMSEFSVADMSKRNQVSEAACYQNTFDEYASPTLPKEPTYSSSSSEIPK